jgi:hypothetical protein
MTIPHAPQHGAIDTLRALLALALLALITAAPAQSQQTPPPDDKQAAPDERQQRIDWRIAMAQIELPKKGCFQSTFPSRDWREVTCVAGPNYPMPPRNGPVPLVVGNGDDIAAQAPSGFISTAIGSFDSLTNVTSLSGPIGNTGPSVANAYTLQINTNFFSNSVCSGAAVPANCSAWEQFVFENNNVSHRAFIQYWIIRYDNPCPTGQSWNQITLSGHIYCWKNNSGGVVNTDAQPVGNLANLSISGNVTATSDTVTVSDGTNIWARNGDNAVAASTGWTIAEFNILGDGGNSASGGMVSFNAGADVVARTRVFYGDRQAPNCVAQGFTAETNNLSFGLTAPAASQPGPAVIFRESTAGGAASNCAAAVTVGDTHLQTFGGLFYDFQAQGDFLLAQVDDEFVVQARQKDGAPTWPNTSVNQAVAAQLGKTKVAVCLGAPINVDGENKDIADGASLLTTDGTTIWHTGNAYTIIGPTGHSVRATVHSDWIDVSVGLGQWPVNVTGLLANVNGDVNKLAGRDGTVYTNPIAFETLYGRFGDSWRVSAKDSLLDACGGGLKAINPTRPFYAQDLDKAVYDRTRAVCVSAGVRGETLLDACTLDVAVIGEDEAAKVFVDFVTPVAEAKPTWTDRGGDAWWKKWWWLILLLIILVLWILLRKKH